MGLQQSKEELLYQQVTYGNVDGIKALHAQGAGLEWVDKEGKTPLIAASMRPDGHQVAHTLLDLGANVDAYRPGGHAGTPLHHAAKRGLLPTVRLLLSHGANALRLNDDCRTALDLARAKGFYNVVRTIETHTSLFSGWLRELYGPSFLEVLAPQWLSRNAWVVVLPCDHRNPMKPQKFQLVIYPELQQLVDEEEVRSRRRRRRRRRKIERKTAQPRTIIALWKVKIEELDMNQLDPVVVIFDKSTKTRYKFLSAHEGDKQQLLRFYNACRGMPQVIPSPTPPEGVPMHTSTSYIPGTSTSMTPVNAPAAAPEDAELAMAISASIQSAIAEGVSPIPDSQLVSQGGNTDGWGDSGKADDNAGSMDQPSSSTETTNRWSEKQASNTHIGWAVPEPGSTTVQINQNLHEALCIVPPAEDTPPVMLPPSAPPVTEETFAHGPVHYPPVDSSPVDLNIPQSEGKSGTTEEKENGDVSGTCVICLDAAVEGACVPCGHMAGCMSCLNEIKAKDWGCPVCRTKINQVIKLFSV